jgi:hypothetical protein
LLYALRIIRLQKGRSYKNTDHSKREHRMDIKFTHLSTQEIRIFDENNCTRWFKYDRDWFVCKQCVISPGHIWTTLYEWLDVGFFTMIVFIAVKVICFTKWSVCSARSVHALNPWNKHHCREWMGSDLS